MAVTKIHFGNLDSDVFAINTIALGMAMFAGTSGKAVQTDDTILAFDATDPSTQAFGDAADVGAAAVTARRDHKHAMPAVPTAGDVAAIATAFLDAKGDLISASADDTPVILTVGADDTILMADVAETSGLKWVASQAPSNQAFDDVAAEGTADSYSRGDHLHGMPATPVGAGTQVFNEVPTGDLDGVDATYTLANTPTAATLVVYKNGMRQNVGAGLDYTIATNVITFEAGNLPQTGDVVLADYSY